MGELHYFLSIIFLKLATSHALFFPLFRLGGDEGSMLLSWETLNPMSLVRQMGAFAKSFDLNAFEEYMKRVRARNQHLFSLLNLGKAGACLFFFPHREGEGRGTRSFFSKQPSCFFTLPAWTKGEEGTKFFSPFSPSTQMKRSICCLHPTSCEVSLSSSSSHESKSRLLLLLLLSGNEWILRGQEEDEKGGVWKISSREIFLPLRDARTERSVVLQWKYLRGDCQTKTGKKVSHATNGSATMTKREEGSRWQQWFLPFFRPPLFPK